MRKIRRKIKRKKDKKRNKSKKRHIGLYRHFICAPSNIWIKLTTYLMVIFEAVFIIWWLQDVMLNWQEILIKLENLGRVLIGG